ncbi:hypothetical protein BH11ARM2_BH11ARM2_19050 [soil metagenome]
MNTKQPMAEVFGFPVGNVSPMAVRYRNNRLCPFNNRVPNCTKDKAENPLGVCSVFEGTDVVVTCPIRFRQEWLIAEDAAGFFFDPPYTATGKRAGTRLYTHFSLDHERLFEMSSSVRGDLLMTYDNAGGVVDLARRHRLDFEAIPMKNTHHTEMTELLIGKDLSWARATMC